MKHTEYAETVMEELSVTQAKIDNDASEAFQNAVLAAKEIFVAGAGRSGFMARGFAMRLMHMGKKAYVVGEVVTPNISAGDVLVICSGSGETESLVGMAKKAKKLGAKVLLVTIFPSSSIADIADVIVVIPAPTPKSEQKQEMKSIQPMGSLFEQSLLLCLDIIILGMMEKEGQTSDNMFGRHANLE